uniref:Uncharacterized protein n=1 Tax=Cannabis sativa TaxID=3483 RepID=A0A803P6C8_CANSA
MCRRPDGPDAPSDGPDARPMGSDGPIGPDLKNPKKIEFFARHRTFFFSSGVRPAAARGFYRDGCDGSGRVGGLVSWMVLWVSHGLRVFTGVERACLGGGEG